MIKYILNRVWPFLFLFGILIWVVAFFHSCRSCKENAITVIKDTTIIKEVVKHDTSWLILQVPGPEKIMPNPCSWLCDSAGKLKKFNVVSNGGGMTQVLKSAGDTLIQECKADSLMKIVIEKDKEITRLKETTKNKIEYINELKWWQKAMMFLGFICLCFIILLVISGINHFLKRN